MYEDYETTADIKKISDRKISGEEIFEKKIHFKARLLAAVFFRNAYLSTMN